MTENIRFPVYMAEIETGEIKSYDEVSELRLVVEEFWDILDQDFKFWDKDGYPIYFKSEFINNINEEAEKGDKCEKLILKKLLLEIAYKKGLPLEKFKDKSLSDIYSSISE